MTDSWTVLIVCAALCHIRSSTCGFLIEQDAKTVKRGSVRRFPIRTPFLSHCLYPNFHYSICLPSSFLGYFKSDESFDKLAFRRNYFRVIGYSMSHSELTRFMYREFLFVITNLEKIMFTEFLF